MSHFSVAVITKGYQNIDNLLAPFSENLAVEPYILQTKEEIIATGRAEVAKYLASDDEQWKAESKKYFLPLLNAKTDEELYKAQCDYYGYTNFDEDGNVLTTYNKKSKWDWYVVGGRFTCVMPVKPGTEYVAQDAALLKDIDFSPNAEKYRRCKRFWEVYVDKAPLLPGEEENQFFSIYKPEFYKERYGDADTYARINASFSTFAILDADGNWHEKGEMGWFGLSSETNEESMNWDNNYEALLKKLADPEDWITIVDCHI